MQGNKKWNKSKIATNTREKETEEKTRERERAGKREETERFKEGKTLEKIL